jgi:hypothetical protein
VTEPSEDRTVEQPAVSPTVSTAPPPSRMQRWWASIPSHVGPARTSTVVLAVLFLALGALYLTVRPQSPQQVATSTSGGQVAATTTAHAPRTTAPTTTAPTTTESVAPTTTAPNPTDATPTTAVPTVTSGSQQPTATVVPTTPTATRAPTSAPPPTASSSPIG